MAALLAEHANDANLDAAIKVLKILPIHYLVEIDVGDTYIYDTTAMEDQTEREQKAAEQIFNLLPV